MLIEVTGYVWSDSNDFTLFCDNRVFLFLRRHSSSYFYAHSVQESVILITFAYLPLLLYRQLPSYLFLCNVSDEKLF